MPELRASTLLCFVFAACALALTGNEVLRPWSAAELRLPDNAGVGGLVLAALVAATAWLVRDARGDAIGWSKAAFTLSIVLPLMWTYQRVSMGRDLARLPDGELPQGWSETVTGDIFQTHLVALAVTLGVLACVIAAGAQRDLDRTRQMQ